MFQRIGTEKGEPVIVGAKLTLFPQLLDPYYNPNAYVQPGVYHGMPPPTNDVTFTNQYYDPNTQQQFWTNYYPQRYEPTPLPQSTGKRKALLIGINYFGTKSQLKGCINDARNIYDFLVRRGYSPELIHMLCDDTQDPFWMPTRNNIIREINWLVSDAVPGDHLFFLFSGHGGQKEDTNGDEEDGYDETILPCDYRKAGSIVDDDLHDWIVKRIPMGAKLTALMDCCHSGTGLDLPFVYTVSTMDNDNQVPSKSHKKRKNHHGTLQNQQILHEKMSWGDVTLFSGCRDDQTSSDATSLGSMPQGAMCYAFLKVLQHATRVLTYHEVLVSMRQVLKSAKFSQVPQLSTGRPIDLNQPFYF